MAGVAESAVECEELFEAVVDVGERRENGVDGEMLSFGVNEISAGIVAEDVNVAVGVGGKTAGEGGEVG